MTNPIDAVSTANTAVLAAWSSGVGFRRPAGADGASRSTSESGDAADSEATAASASTRCLSDNGLLGVNDAVLVRAANALQSACSAEIAHRSRPELGREGLAAVRGFMSATAERISFTGELLPAAPHVAEALNAGLLSVQAAGLITSMLDRVLPAAGAEKCDTAERIILSHAATLTLEMLTRLVKGAEALLDPDGVKPREDQLRADHSVSIVEDSTGALVLKGRFDPENGAVIKNAIYSLVGTELRRARGAFGSAAAQRECRCGAGVDASNSQDSCCCAAAVFAERRTIAQMLADALADIARHAIACDDLPTGASSVVVVRAEAPDVMAGTGSATIDGIDQPISMQTARRLMARPPSFVHARHINWWERDDGPTALANGVLLCSFHHYLVHDEGWLVEVIDARVWFTPPAHIDPTRTPRPGNTLRRTLQEIQKPPGAAPPPPQSREWNRPPDRVGG